MWTAYCGSKSAQRSEPKDELTKFLEKNLFPTTKEVADHVYKNTGSFFRSEMTKLLHAFTEKQIVRRRKCLSKNIANSVKTQAKTIQFCLWTVVSDVQQRYVLRRRSKGSSKFQ